MISTTNTVGIIGEQAAILAFVSHGYQVSTPVGNNARYDLVVDIDGRFVRIQVKTTQCVKNGLMVFGTCKSNPYKHEGIRYNKNEVDFFALYCIENGYLGLFPVSEQSLKQTTLRLEKPRSKQRANVKFADDYEFNKMIGML